MATRDPWGVLGVVPGAEGGVVDAAYRRLARRFHPDANPGADTAELTARMAEVNWARHELVANPGAWQPRKPALDWAPRTPVEPPRRSAASAAQQPPPIRPGEVPRPAAPPPATPVGGIEIDLTHTRRPRPAGLNWGSPQADTMPPTAEPPLEIDLTPKRRRGTGGLNWTPPRSRRDEPDAAWVPRKWSEWRQANPEATPSSWRPGGPAPERRSEAAPLPAVLATPRVLELAGQAGAFGVVTARVETGGPAHLQARWREGPFRVSRLGGRGGSVEFLVTVTDDLVRPSAAPVLLNLDLVAPGYEAARVLVSLAPLTGPASRPVAAADLLPPAGRIRWA